MEEVSFPKRPLIHFEWRGACFLVSLTLISCILVALLTGAGLIPEQNYPQAQSVVLTSSLDPATYKTILLDNGLQVTLISNPNSTRTSAGIAAPVGWASDPYYFPGRAEYLQNVLLHGSANYPSPQSFAKVLVLGAGQLHAATYERVTALNFEIESKDLTMALKQFSDALVAPNLFPEEGIVLSTSHYSELAEILISANSTVRTDASLSGVAVRTELLRLFRRHYAPASMWAVVAGNYNLTGLEQVARDFFTQIPTRSVSTDDSSNAFSRGKLNQLVYVSVHPGGDKLEVHFVLDDLSVDPLLRPTKYLESVFSYSGVNSTFEALSNRGIATSWDVQTKDYGDYVVLTFLIGLTPYGVERWEECTAAIYEFVSLLQGDPTLVEQSWTAYRTAAANLMRYSSFPTLGDKVHAFLRSVLQYGPHNAYSAEGMLYTYDEDAVMRSLQMIVPKRSLAILHSGEQFAQAEGSVQEAGGYFYKSESLRTHVWARQGNLTVPTSLLYDGGSLGVYRCDPYCQARNTRPNIVSASDFHTLWFRRQPDLPVPRVFFGVNVLLPQAGESLRSTALLGVLRCFVLNKVYPKLIPALQNDAELSIFPWPTGIAMHLEAWYEGFEGLAQALFAALETAQTMSQGDFELSRLHAVDYFLTVDVDLGRDLAGSLLFKNTWANRDLAEAALSLTYNDMLVFCAATLPQQFLDLVVSGSYPQDRAELFFSELVGNYTLGLSKLSSSEVSLPALADLDGFYVRRDVTTGANYSLTVSFPWQRFSVESQAAAELLVDIFQLNGPLSFSSYDAVAKLRQTFKETVGVLPTVSADFQWGYTFLTVSLQSSDPQGRLSAVYSFFSSLGSLLSSLPDEAFSRNSTEAPFRSLSERGEAEMQEVLTHFYYFTRSEEVRAAKQSLTKSRFMELYAASMGRMQALAVELFPASSEIQLDLPAGTREAGAVLGLGYFAAEPTTFRFISKA